MTAFLSQTLVPALFNMSLTAGIVILCVMAARLALKRAPKVFSYALWAVVLFRLLCPVSLPSGFSLLGALDAPARQASPVVSTVTYVQPQQQEVMPQIQPQTAEPNTSAADPVAPVTPVTPERTEVPVDWAAVAAWVWLAGAAGMAGYSIFALFRLRRRLVGSLHLRDNIYLADHISTPFVLGLVRPKIYLPSTLTEGEMGYIIRHEQYHIRHGDHVVKVLAFAALCLHWFNPLVWAAFVLAGRDMEMRCDEAVVKELGEKVKADYSASLLTLATGRLTIAGTPLAFGEGNPEGRIRNLLRWKRPRVWLSAVAGMACAAVIAACASNPAGQASQTLSGGSGQYASMEDFAQQTMDGAKEVTYSRYSEETDSAEEVTVPVQDTRLERLDKLGKLEGLAPEGTLEAWAFGYLVQVDVPAQDIVSAGGSYQGEGWVDLENTGSHSIVSLRYPDGTYDILLDQPVNDDGQFYGHHNSYEEAIYDWYVAEKGLDLPLYVEEWRVLVLAQGGERALTVPARRYDGEGWYLYVPVGWKQRSGDLVHCVWASPYDTGSAVTVDYTKTNLADYLAGDTGGMTPAGDSGRVFTSQTDGWTYRYYYVEGTEGCWKITIQYQDGVSADYPEIMAEPEILRLMAESFTPDSRITPAAEGPLSIPLTAAESCAPVRAGQGLDGQAEVTTADIQERLAELTLTDGTEVLFYRALSGEKYCAYIPAGTERLIRFTWEDNDYGSGGYSISAFEHVLGRSGFHIQCPRGAAYAADDYYYFDDSGALWLLADCGSAARETDLDQNGDKELLWDYHGGREVCYLTRIGGQIYRADLCAMTLEALGYQPGSGAQITVELPEQGETGGADELAYTILLLDQGGAEAAQRLTGTIRLTADQLEIRPDAAV